MKLKKFLSLLLALVMTASLLIRLSTRRMPGPRRPAPPPR